MNRELQVQNFLKHLEDNGDLRRFTTRWDNKKAPVHRWFPFLVGFSHSLVKETINFFKEDDGGCLVFDPFMGSGTTGVVGKEIGVNVVGNEINPFLYKICKVKLSSPKNSDITDLLSLGKRIMRKARQTWKRTEIDEEHALLPKCYPVENLKKLVTLRELTTETPVSTRHKPYFFVILTRCLLSASRVGINVPYVTWSSKKRPEEVFMVFKKNLRIIFEDLNEVSKIASTNTQATVFLHDSRIKNKRIRKKSIDIIFTSPPYLNNFDYGESLKVFLYFWKIANNWGEISEKIRKVSIISATTHYRKSEFASKPYEEMLGKHFLKAAPDTSQDIIRKAELIRERILEKKGEKSYDLLTTLYFKDMFLVLKELRRVLKEGSLCFMVIGDSAHYGVHIPTDVILGEMGLELGFSSYTLKPLRERGIKWKNLHRRHKRRLRESLLILRR